MKKIYNYLQSKSYVVSNNFVKCYQYIYYAHIRKNLKNKDFSLFSPNCYAGLIYHRLGLQFMSPTINMLFPSKKEYLRFVSDLKRYLSLDLVESEDERFPFPVGVLGDIELVFNHYKSFDEAKTAWDKRKQRINYDNIFIIFDDYVDAEYDDLVKFNQIPCRGKVILTANEYPDLENTIQIKKYSKDHIMKAYLLEKNRWTGKCPADKDFDFVRWLNGEDIFNANEKLHN